MQTQPLTKQTTQTKKHDTDLDIILLNQYQLTKVFDSEGNLVGKDQKLRNKLATRNQKLINFVINKFFSHRQLQQDIKEDLMQEGMIGMFEAIDNFDPSRGFMFSTYAMWWIKQACSNFLCESTPTFHIPSHVRTTQNKIVRELAANNESLYDIDDAVAAKRFGVTSKMLRCIKAALQSKWVQSIHDPVYTDEVAGLTLEDTIIDNSSETSEVTIDSDTIVKSAAKALKNLSERERMILLLRFNII